MSISIAIDGPVSSGKSTLSEEVAQRLKMFHLNTGAMYRALALYLIENNIDINDEEKVADICQSGHAEISVRLDSFGQATFLNGDDVSQRIREEEVGLVASFVSTYKEVREHMVALQQKIAENNNIVLDGRDIGTVVLPNADVKIFLTASKEVRAKRRYMELLSRGINAEYEDVLKDLIQRDKQDMQRKVSPLRQADDAIYLDNSDMTFEETVEEVIRIVEKKNEEKRG